MSSGSVDGRWIGSGSIAGSSANLHPQTILSVIGIQWNAILDFERVGLYKVSLKQIRAYKLSATNDRHRRWGRAVVFDEILPGPQIDF